MKTALLIAMAGLIASLILFQTCAPTTAQNETSFTPAHKFALPSIKGEISFAMNGTYATATLTNETWNFTNLKLVHLQPLKTLAVSAQNSTVIVTSYRVGNATYGYAYLRYIAEGKGKQTFNIGIPAGEGRWGLHPEWSVIVNNVWLGESDGWTITRDGTVTVTGAVGNVSIVHYSFLSQGDNSSDLPFYQQHSIAIATVALVVATAAIAFLIASRSKGSQSSEDSLLLFNDQKQFALRKVKK